MDGKLLRYIAVQLTQQTPTVFIFITTFQQGYFFKLGQVERLVRLFNNKTKPLCKMAAIARTIQLKVFDKLLSFMLFSQVQREHIDTQK